jgi:HSP20 family protein
MNLTRFEPWGIVDLLHRDLDRIAASRLPTNDTDGAVTDWIPAVDIIEAGVLSVSGHRYEEARSEDAGMQRVERVSGRFFRRFSLPDTADADSVKAQCKNGILEVTIPKLPEVQARRIEVEAA